MESQHWFTDAAPFPDGQGTGCHRPFAGFARSRKDHTCRSTSSTTDSISNPDGRGTERRGTFVIFVRHGEGHTSPSSTTDTVSIPDGQGRDRRASADHFAISWIRKGKASSCPTTTKAARQIKSRHCQAPGPQPNRLRNFLKPAPLRTLIPLAWRTFNDSWSSNRGSSPSERRPTSDSCND